jgi:uncharacterized protein (TIGR00255 family)
MSARSMTGFGQGRAVAGGLAVTVEVSSVNRKQFDARLDVPRALAGLEPRLAELIRARLSRGSVTCSVRLDDAAGGRGPRRVDVALAAACLRDLRQAARALGLKDDLTATALLSLPGVVRTESAWSPEAARPLVERALERALARHAAMRAREGRALAADLRGRLRAVERRLGRIERLAPEVALRYRENLLRRVGEAGVTLQGADDKLLREVAVYADRCDISEETVRLRSHLAQGRAALDSDEPVGRSLDFLIQEMFREINTIGSKANDAAIAREVVAIKAELERVREQVQNLE